MISITLLLCSFLGLTLPEYWSSLFRSSYERLLNCTIAIPNYMQMYIMNSRHLLLSKNTTAIFQLEEYTKGVSQPSSECFSGFGKRKKSLCHRKSSTTDLVLLHIFQTLMFAPKGKGYPTSTSVHYRNA